MQAQPFFPAEYNRLTAPVQHPYKLAFSKRPVTCSQTSTFQARVHTLARSSAAACPQHVTKFTESSFTHTRACPQRRAKVTMSIRKRKRAALVPFAGQEPKHVTADQVQQRSVYAAG